MLFFQGISLALRSHDQFKGSHWSTPTLLATPTVAVKGKGGARALQLFFCDKRPFGGGNGGKNKKKVSVLLSRMQDFYYCERGQEWLTPVALKSNCGLKQKSWSIEA